MVMEFVPEQNVYRGWLPDGVGIEVPAQPFLEALPEVRDDPGYWDEWTAEHSDCFDWSDDWAMLKAATTSKILAISSTAKERLKHKLSFHPK